MTKEQFASNKLLFHRKQAGLFQKDVAKALGLECMDRISHWENGIAMPNVVPSRLGLEQPTWRGIDA